MNNNRMNPVTVIDGNCFGVSRKDDRRNDLEYKMDHKYRGLALIFSHENFDNDKLRQRVETDVDSKNLTEVLRKLDFCVKLYKDMRHQEVMEKITKAAAMDHTDHDCILIAVLSHGECDYIHARDTIYRMDDIWIGFTGDNCPTLAGKPKMFIVEANQGNLRDAGYRMGAQTQTDSDSNGRYRIPIYADFVIAFSTIPNYCTWVDSVKGSWFIYSLCQELSANGKQMDLLMLLTFVAQRVAVDFETYEEGFKQIACTMSTLTRIVRFADRKIATSP